MCQTRNNATPAGLEQHTSRTKVLGMEDTMRKVMDIVGKGYHIFIAGVSKDWRRLYSCVHPELETSLECVVEAAGCVNWAVRQGYTLSREAFQAAAQKGDLGICEALHRHGCPWDEEVCEATAFNPDHGLSILKWLRSEDLPDKSACPWDEQTSFEAAMQGDVEMLTWLLSDEANAPYDHNCWCMGAAGGHINVLEMLSRHPRIRADLEAAEYGSEWRAGPFNAVSGGHTAALHWLQANARDLCDWDSEVCNLAATGVRDLEVLQWLRSEDVMCEWDEFSCPEVYRSVFGSMERGGQFEEIKEWVHANGHPCDCED